MLTIDEIFNKILIRSGHFIIKKNNVELDVDRFRVLVQDALDVYSDFSPYHQEYTLNLQGARQQDLSTLNPDFGRKPDFLSEVHPIRAAGTVYGNYPHTVHGHGYGSHYQSEELSDPIQAPWKYNKETGVLSAPYNTYYKVVAVWRHQIDETEIDGVPTYVVRTVSGQDHPFIKLCMAMFMMGLGRSRKAFTLNDLPILIDSSEIVAEGRELYKEVIDEELKNKQKFYLAYGG